MSWNRNDKFMQGGLTPRCTETVPTKGFRAQYRQCSRKAEFDDNTHCHIHSKEAWQNRAKKTPSPGKKSTRLKKGATKLSTVGSLLPPSKKSPAAAPIHKNALVLHSRIYCHDLPP